MTTTIKMPLRKVTQHVLRDLQQKYPDAEMQLALGGHKADRDGLLTDGQFWELIHLLDWSKTGDDDAVVEPLVAALATGPIRQIFDFADILSQKLYALDGLKFALHIGESSYKPDAHFSSCLGIGQTQIFQNLMHGNSKKSDRPHHLYGIYEESTDELFKYGISGEKVRADGTSKRMRTQVNSLNLAARGINRFAH